jgi:hypothetical protein
LALKLPPLAVQICVTLPWRGLGIEAYKLIYSG